MRCEKIQHSAEHGRFPQPGAKVIGCQPGQREQAAGPVIAFQQPAERAEGKGLGINGG